MWRMNWETSPLRVHDWIPASGHALRHAGIHFDAVRVDGPPGERIMYDLTQLTEFHVGPVIREATGARYFYFLLPPGTAKSYGWPAGARPLGRSSAGFAYVGVPALDGWTWPLDWRSLPTAEAPFIEGQLLHDVTRRVAR